jgi:hypothetical protein
MPARLASDSPIAIACWGDLAPCSPWRTFSISSRTNSPACVLGDLPERLSCIAFRMVCFLGIELLLVQVGEPEFLMKNVRIGETIP